MRLSQREPGGIPEAPQRTQSQKDARSAVSEEDTEYGAHDDEHEPSAYNCGTNTERQYTAEASNDKPNSNKDEPQARASTGDFKSAMIKMRAMMNGRISRSPWRCVSRRSARRF